jgi:hypothetical protein
MHRSLPNLVACSTASPRSPESPEEDGCDELA